MKNCATEKKIRLGIIGTNFVSDWLTTEAKDSGLYEVRAVYSRKSETGEAYANKHAIPVVYTDMEAFLSDPELDAVYVSSPNACHAAQSIDALRHGKHVLCEKPIATTAAEYRDMQNAARENGRILLEAMRPAHDPAILAIRDHIDALGTIRRVELEFCQYSSRYDRFKAGEILNAFTPALGNAAIMDIGVYAVHVCALLFGMPELTADFYSRSVFAENHMELMGEMLLPYGADAPVRITYAKIYNSLNPSVILGENGGILIDKLSNPKSVRLKLRDGTDKELCVSPKDNNMVYELAAFARCIRTGNNPHTRCSEIEMAILDRIREKNGIVFR